MISTVLKGIILSILFCGVFFSSASVASAAFWSVDTTSPPSCFSGAIALVCGTIQQAVNEASNGDTILVLAGTYAEDVTVNKELTLEARSGVYLTGKITIASSSVSVSGFDITNPSQSFGVVISGVSNVSVTGNTIHHIGSSLASGAAQAIYLQASTTAANAIDNVTISGNTISYIGSLGLAHGGAANSNARGIFVGPPTATNGTITNLTISGNSIANVFTLTTAFVASGGGGAGAYGILINFGGSTTATISNNQISTLEGLWAHGIGLERNTPGTVLSNNTLSGLTDHKVVPDAHAVYFENNTSASSVLVDGQTRGSLSAVAVNGTWKNSAGNPLVRLESGYYIYGINAFGTIQSGINAAQAGGTVRVAAGAYVENATTTKGISLIGAGSSSTSIAPTTGTALTIMGGNLPQPTHGTVDGFTLQGFTLSGTSGFTADMGTPDDSYYTSNLTLRDIKIVSTTDGIMLKAVQGATLENMWLESISGTTAGALALAGVSGLTVNNSTFKNNAVAMRLFSTDIGSSAEHFGANGSISVSNSFFTGNGMGINNQDSSITIATSNNELGVTSSGDTQLVSTPNGTVGMEIPSGAVVRGTLGWSGTIMPPAATTTSLSVSGFDVSVISAVAIGSDEYDLTFDKAVKLTFAGQTGKRVGWYNKAGTFAEIITTCADNTQATNDVLAAGTSCKYDTGTDMVVWTKHFSTFVVYTQTAVVTTTSSGGGSGGGGGGGGGAPVGFLGTTNTIVAAAASVATTSAVAPAATTTATTTSGGPGQILGAEVYNFTKNLVVGSAGADVIELQRILIAEGFLKIAAPVGTYGPATKAAVAKYQAAHGISPQNGLVRALTRAELNKGTLLQVPVSSSAATSGLSGVQVEAILGLLNSFGADAATVANVKAALGR